MNWQVNGVFVSKIGVRRVRNPINLKKLQVHCRPNGVKFGNLQPELDKLIQAININMEVGQYVCNKKPLPK
jgi:hypothetical protein